MKYSPMKLSRLLAAVLLVAAASVQAAPAASADDAGSEPAVMNGLLWLAGLGLVGVMVERVKRRRV
jgi:hypothetical protein